MEIKLYKCAICGQIVAVVEETGVPLICCGEEMQQMIPGSVDASLEKHVPVIEVDGRRVTVRIGSAAHPMTREHFIEWILLETKCGCQIRKLTSESEPKACFSLCEGDAVKAAYAYCNLHGLWKVKLA